MDRQMNRQSDRQMDRQSDRHTDGQSDRQTDRWTIKLMDGCQTDGHKTDKVYKFLDGGLVQYW